MDKRIGNLVETYTEDIDENRYERVILDTCLQCGETGLSELKKLFNEAKLDMGSYNQAIEKIIKMLLKNSDLLD